MNNKKGLVKYLILSLLIFIVFIVGINAYSNILKNKLTDQVRVTLSEVAYQNKMVVESQISEQRNLVQELALVLNSEEVLINNHVLEIIKKVYEAGDYKNIGIVTPEKTVYISSNGEFTIEEKDYFENLEDKESLIILDNDTINNQYSIFISEPVTSNNGGKGCLFFSYDLKLLVSKLSIPSFNGEGYTYIVDRNGNKILNSNNKNSFSNFTNIFDAMLKVDENNLETVNTLKAKIKNNEEGIVTFSNETNKDMYYLPLNINDWYILTVVPSTTINSTYNSIMLMTLIFTICIVVLLSILLLIIITTNYIKNKKLYNLIYVDPVTKGYSFTKFSNEITLRGNNYKKKALIALDINNFKLVNTLFGYEESNKILKEITNIIDNECSIHGFSTRKMADHYLIYYEYGNDEKLLHFIEKIYNSICNLRILNSDYVLVPSMGIYTFTKLNESIDNLENKAIIAWKNIKNDNYTYYGLFDDKILNTMVDNKKILDKLINAIENDKLEIHYQPKYDTILRKIVGAEALLRFRDNNGHMISPGIFIPIAEESGFITVIDNYVFEKVCMDINKLKEKNIETVPISINLSRKKLEEGIFVKDYLKIIKENNISVSDIEIEITEGTILADNKSIKHSVKKLKESGFNILVDDFGTGYSSISTLKDLDIDEIKVDRSFITDDSEKSKEIVKYVFNLATALKVKTTAEGVETKEQYNMLKKLNCNTIQGYYFSRVITLIELEMLLEKNK